MKSVSRFAALGLVLAVAALAVLAFVPDAFASPIGFAGHAGGFAHTDLVAASAALITLRADYAAIVAKVKAKAAELVDGLKPEQIAAIEKDHATLVTERNAIEAKIAAEETRLATPLAVTDTVVKPWAAAFYAKAGKSGLDIISLNTIVSESATMEAATDALLAKIGETRNSGLPGPGGVSVGTEATEKFVKGATAALINKISMFNSGKPDPAGERNEFSGFSLRELARHSLQLRGITNLPHDPMLMIGSAFAPVVMAGALSTSDFSNVLANVAHKSMLKGYEEAPETFDAWTSTGTLTDFKTATRVDLGLFPSLATVDEGAEYTMASMSDRKVTLVLATYGKLFPITRQAIVNDDLNAFSKVPGKMGMAAKRTIGNLVYAILTSNPTMGDGVALFHATHNNLISGGSSAMSASAFDTGRATMAKQKDPDNIKQGLNITPAYVISPVGLIGTAKQILFSQSEPGQNNPGVANRVQGMATPIADARLDVASATAWYLAGGQQYDTIEVDYLNGVQVPTLETKEGWTVDGVEFKVRMDAGVNLLDFRALQKNVGA